MKKKPSLILFAKSLAGKYSNKLQAEKNPKHFAHINIYFRPLDWDILDGPWIYSEQSYEYQPWSPYRQGIHQISIIKDLIIVENYALNKPERIAGSGFKPELLREIKKHGLKKREGCAMHFKERTPGSYYGNVEPGKKCLVNRDGYTTYLVSEVEFNNENWTSIDKGLNINNNKIIWGAEHGALKFKKVENLDNEFKGKWLNLS